jgi:hypothetical protein
VNRANERKRNRRIGILLAAAALIYVAAVIFFILAY